MNHVGRFAPSPSGHLHFGSFITALASFLHAKSHHGEWLVRIEDIDPPREMQGAASHILSTLERLSLHWDREVIYQSNRTQRYQEIIALLLKQDLAYYCDCTRQRIHQLTNSIYDNHCRNRYLSPTINHPMAIRIKQHHPVYDFIDKIRGYQKISNKEAEEDFIIHRKDGLFAYNLAVIIDDHDQGITDIVRGADLLPVTPKQISLYQLLNFSVPNYYHLPLALNSRLDKLSKQNHAPCIKLDNIVQLTVDALSFLGQPIPNDWQDATQTQLLHWAITHWNIALVPTKNHIVSTG